MSLVPEDKQETAKAIQKYLDEVFYPKLYQMYNLKKDGLSDLVKEYLITGKKAYEIVYDSLKNPKDIIGMIPIDPSTLQKFKKDDLVWYVQKPLMDNNQKDRILHENQVVLIEWNKYDYGYVSYVDTLRRPFNVMRSMQTAKILWFAVKSQVRMHIKLALGDIARTDAIQKLSEARNNYTNQYAFSDETGQVMFNNSPLSTGYREFFTAETIPAETSNENQTEETESEESKLSDESQEGLQNEIDCNKLTDKPIDECVENLYSKTLRESREFAKSIGKSEVFETIVDCINKSHKFSYYHCGRLIRNGISIEKLKQFYNEFKTYGIQNKTEDTLLKALDEFISAIPENTEK